MTPRVVLASHNAHKLAELRRLAVDAGVALEVVGLDEVAAYPEPAETEWSFEGNALIKAREATRRTGLPAIADDSGIEVDVLNNMPGVRSARWAGPQHDDRDNLELLLAQVDDLPDQQRQARFVCAAAFCTPDGFEHVVRGVMSGRLAREPKGVNGFGYDPIFITDGHDVTNGELSADEKDAISHRGQAMRELLPLVVAHLTASHQG